MDAKLDEDHFSLTSCSDVREICKPLFENFGFTHFHLRKTFNDRSRAVLCTNPEWVKYFYGTKKYDNYGIYEDVKPTGEITSSEFLFHEIQYNSFKKQSSDVAIDQKTSFVLWRSLYDLPVFNLVFEEAKHFNIDHGITVTDKDEDSCTFYQIGTTPENAHLNNFYLNNFDVLKIFINYFKDKGAHLIELAKKNRISPDYSIIKPHFIKNEEVTFNEKIQRFLKQTQLQSNKLEILSPREMQLVQYLSRGYSAKQIANVLQLSHRTIESYVANIKVKLQCFTKAQLTQYLHELNINSRW